MLSWMVVCVSLLLDCGFDIFLGVLSVIEV